MLLNNDKFVYNIKMYLNVTLSYLNNNMYCIEIRFFVLFL